MHHRTLLKHAPRRRSRKWPASYGWTALGLVLLLVLVALVVRQNRVRPAPPPVAEPPSGSALPDEPRPPPGLVFTFPTPQTDLDQTDSPDVYMPTASGRVESALFGSTRTANVGGRLAPRFHKAIDISPTQRDARGRPLDDILAVADGEVVYVNRAPGNSSYGRYVVLSHADPVGPVYSLYAHLADVADAIRPGRAVARGTVLGRMGNSAPYTIPLARAHLHFELGVALHRRFGAWYAARKGRQDHGDWNGLNLFGIDPLHVLLRLGPENHGSVAAALAATPPAFTLLLAQKKPFDYFRRYAPLLEPGAAAAPVLVVEVSEGGVPLRARAATEADRAAGAPPRVLAVDEEVLGRNGQGLIRRQGAGWDLTARGQDWINLLTY